LVNGDAFDGFVGKMFRAEHEAARGALRLGCLRRGGRSHVSVRTLFSTQVVVRHPRVSVLALTPRPGHADDDEHDEDDDKDKDTDADSQTND